MCTQDNLFGDALTAVDKAGDRALKLVLMSQCQDSCEVNTVSLISLFSKMRSYAIAESCKPRHTSVLTRACCAAASFLTTLNAATYRVLLAKFGDDPYVCTFVLFAMSKINSFLQHLFDFESDLIFGHSF